MVVVVVVPIGIIPIGVIHWGVVVVVVVPVGIIPIGVIHLRIVVVVVVPIWILIGFQAFNEWDYIVPEYISEGIITLFAGKSAVKANS